MAGGVNQDFNNGDVPPEEMFNPHSSSSSCSYLNQDRAPWTRIYHKQVGLTVCGDNWNGDNPKNCETFVDGQWRVSHNLPERRVLHSIWHSPEGILLMGGYYSGLTTELLKADGTSVYKFALPYSLLYVVCMS